VAIVRCAVLALAVALACVRPAAAQNSPTAPLLRVVVSTSGRAIFDSLLATIATRANLADQLSVKYADPLTALRNFCQNTAGSSPDIVLATHRMQAALTTECANNGVGDVAVVELGRSALILAVRSGSMLSGLTSRQVYLALARDVPVHQEFVRNTAARWSDVDPALPAQDIRFQLPMRDDGSRAMFDELVLEGGCRNETAVKAIFIAPQRSARCTTTRFDRIREIPRAQAVRTLLEAPVGTVGVLSQVDIMRSGGQLVGVVLDGMSPTEDNILSASYDYSTSFWLYAKRGQSASPAVAVAIERIVAQAQSEAVIGPDGPLSGLGLVPLPADERAGQRAALAASTVPFGLGSVAGWVTATLSGTWTMLAAGFTLAQPTGPGVQDFTSLMDLAGYRITGISSSIGIIPDASMTFGIAREMSDADQAYLERALYRDSLRRAGALSTLQRRIIRTIMGVSEVGSFEVSKVELDFVPLPKVSFAVSPKDVLRANGQQPAPDAGDGE
jgi:phosphate transport system substrate-binding protein